MNPNLILCRCDKCGTEILTERGTSPKRAVLVTLECVRCTAKYATFKEQHYFDKNNNEIGYNDGYKSIIP